MRAILRWLLGMVRQMSGGRKEGFIYSPDSNLVST